MYRIYHDKTMQRQRRMKRLSVVIIFVVGIICGFWLSASEINSVSASPLPRQATAAHPETPWCQNSSNTSLRMDCSLEPKH